MRSHPALTVAAEWLFLGLAAPFLLFPGRFTLVGLGLIACGWVTRRAMTGQWTVASAAHGPMLLLLVALGVALIPVGHREYSAPRFWGIILDVAAFYAFLNGGATPAGRRLAAFLLLGGGIAFAAVGLVGMVSPPGKLGAVTTVDVAAQGLRTAVQRVVPASNLVAALDADADYSDPNIGFNPNVVAGALTIFAPFAVVLALAGGRMALLAAPVALATLGVVILTQSRSALVGVAVALMVGGLWRARARLGPALVLAPILFGTVVLALAGPDRIAALGGGGETWGGRGELWQRAAAMALDMPVTGIGLNAFPVILGDYYPTEYHRVGTLVPHAHNLYLQTAVDLGLPGLIAFLAVVAVAVRSGLRAVRHQPERALAAGLLLGLLAHAIYGLTDAMALGTKPSPVLWVVLGLLAGLALPGPEGAGRSIVARRAAYLRATPRLLRTAACVMLLLLLAAPLAVNLARAVLQAPDAAARIAHPTVAALVEADLSAATALGWGPYGARAWAARALAARVRGDTDGEIAALTVATTAAPWDPSLAQQLGELELVRGDLDRVVAVWGASRTVETLLKLGDGAAPEMAHLWYEQAHQIDPGDARPYVAIADLDIKTDRLNDAAETLAQALDARRSSAGTRSIGVPSARAAVAARLRDRSAPLPGPDRVLADTADADLLTRAARVLDARSDVTGALFAAELAVQADGTFARWSYLSGLWQRLGETARAAEALQRATVAPR